jgi:hypothetical protein
LHTFYGDKPQEQAAAEPANAAEEPAKFTEEDKHETLRWLRNGLEKGYIKGDGFRLKDKP